MFEITGAAVTLAGIIILYTSRQSLSKQRDILIKNLYDTQQVNVRLNRIASVHGCTPRGLAKEGEQSHCTKCGSTWQANPFTIEWQGDGLKNLINQSWELTQQE